jgi:hypothetical protein
MGPIGLEQEAPGRVEPVNPGVVDDEGEIVVDEPVPEARDRCGYRQEGDDKRRGAARMGRPD